MDVILVVIVARYLAATIPLVMITAYFLQRFYLHTSRQVRRVLTAALIRVRAGN
jgi:ATP-binding cassette subfamily C (CFTR/MRP) protein 1